MKRLATGFWLALAALQLPSCQFPNYNLLLDEPVGGDSGASSGGAGSGSPTGGASGMGGTSEPPLCDEGLSCQPDAPAGWLGPVAYWQGPIADELPDCPEGYAEPTDLNADLAAPPLGCTCSCTAKDLTCEGVKNVSIYNDLGCKNVCFTSTDLQCSEVTTCNGASVSLGSSLAAPTGSCAVSVKVVDREPPTWERATRFCALQVDVDECDAEQSCFPTPAAPFASQLCVYRVVLAGQAPPECPEEYPNGPEQLYSTFEDGRACGECECEGPMGGSCGGTVSYGSNIDCTRSDEYTIGSGCRIIDKPSHLSVQYAMKPGSCGVATEPEPTGEAVPSGNYHAVCCQ
ncbi:MAG: hypothetical protein EOO73_11290 [Myxococcales bacterium]|nr:MAG: hypothetical protein EOO73_11290 [Myxococcales bacterium]